MTTTSKKYPFGANPRQLTNAEARLATVEDRIASVWAWMVRLTNTYLSTLKPHEMAGFDRDDCLQELYLELQKKDRHWDASKGKYLTFASTLARHKFESIRERSQTIRPPRNSFSRLRESEQLATKGQLSAQRQETHEKIRLSRSCPSPSEILDFSATTAPDDSETERRHRIVSKIRRAVAQLPPETAVVITFVHGLWDNPPLPIAVVADRLGKPVTTVSRRIAEGEKRLAAILSEMIEDDQEVLCG